MGLFDKKYCDVCGERIGLLETASWRTGICSTRTVPVSCLRGSQSAATAA